MERTIQIDAIVNLTVIGISHVVRPVDFLVVLRDRGEAACLPSPSPCWDGRTWSRPSSTSRSPRSACEPSQKGMQQLQQGPLAGYMPYTRQTEGILRSLADLKPETLAVMNCSSYTGPGDRLLTDLAGVLKENFDQA